GVAVTDQEDGLDLQSRGPEEQACPNPAPRSRHNPSRCCTHNPRREERGRCRCGSPARWPHHRAARAKLCTRKQRSASCRRRGNHSVMNDMPRPRPPHLRHETTRHGKRVWYMRIDGHRIRLRPDYGSDEFWRQYHAAVNGALQALPLSKARNGSLAWLIERYRETTAWKDLSPATRRNRENHFKQVIGSAGHQPYRSITQSV